jgi:hypothetical protein
MKFLPIHTEALRYFGYTEEEAQFLYLVATHSGYFTCQQFLQFIETKPGKRSVAFARKVVEKKHASAKEYLRHGRVFHLFSSNVYEAIGRENIRFRRAHSTEYIRTRLIAFDFILRNQAFTYLETDEQKLALFCDQMGFDKKILPHKRYSGAIKENYTDRYFVDKFPMFYNPAASLHPVPTFSFIDPGSLSMGSFKTHLDAYLTLFTKLRELRFYYVATRGTNFERAKKLFMRTFERLWNPEVPLGLFDYFHTRRTWDEKNYGKLSNNDILFLNQGQERFGNAGIEDLYQKWRAGQITENFVRTESQKFRTPSQVTFISSTVNGQAALFERHPRQPVSVPVKSSEEASFSGGVHFRRHPGMEVSSRTDPLTAPRMNCTVQIVQMESLWPVLQEQGRAARLWYLLCVPALTSESYCAE